MAIKKYKEERPACFDGDKAATKRIEMCIEQLESRISAMKNCFRNGSSHELTQVAKSAMSDCADIIMQASSLYTLKMVKDGTYKNPSKAPPEPAEIVDWKDVKEGWYELELHGRKMVVCVEYHPGPDALVYGVDGDSIARPLVHSANGGKWRRLAAMSQKEKVY